METVSLRLNISNWRAPLNGREVRAAKEHLRVSELFTSCESQLHMKFRVWSSDPPWEYALSTSSEGSSYISQEVTALPPHSWVHRTGLRTKAGNRSTLVAVYVNRSAKGAADIVKIVYAKAYIMFLYFHHEHQGLPWQNTARNMKFHVLKNEECICLLKTFVHKNSHLWPGVAFILTVVTFLLGPIY